MNTLCSALSKHHTVSWVQICLALGMLCGCVSAGKQKKVDTPQEAWRFSPATGTSKGWVVLLPGASGQYIFDDSSHYFAAAKAFNQSGFDALFVDYKPAYRAYENPPDVETGEKIAWVAGEAIRWLWETHPHTKTLPGNIVGWSLGAEGVLRLVNDADRCSALKLHKAAMYYPSNQNSISLTNHIPLLILAGEADDVIRIDKVRALVAKKSSKAEAVELISYPKVHHGFDIASIAEKRTLRLLPLIGPKATFQYNKSAATDARKRLLAFLHQAH